MRIRRFLLVIAYATYLIHVGLLLTLAPWSAAWNQILAWVLPPWNAWLALPAVKGALTGVGLLHLLLAAAEAVGVRPGSPQPPTR